NDRFRERSGGARVAAQSRLAGSERRRAIPCRALDREARGMSASYTFLPWARQGLGNQIAAVGALRPSVAVALETEVRQLDGTVTRSALPVRNVDLYGPGDIVGIESRAIVRTEPREWITNFEPN